jgi:hypothetical protein
MQSLKKIVLFGSIHSGGTEWSPKALLTAERFESRANKLNTAFVNTGEPVGIMPAIFRTTCV